MQDLSKKVATAHMRKLARHPFERELERNKGVVEAALARLNRQMRGLMAGQMEDVDRKTAQRLQKAKEAAQDIEAASIALQAALDQAMRS